MTEEEKINKILSSHFIDLFKSSYPKPNDIRKTVSNIEKNLTEEENEQLNREFSVEEFKDVVFAMGPLKPQGRMTFKTSFTKNIRTSWEMKSPSKCCPSLTRRKWLRK